MLVEGITDKSLLTRVKRCRSAELGHEAPGVIDITDMLNDPSLAGMGRKAIIQHLIDRLPEQGAIVPALEAKLGSLKDREWDGLAVNMPLVDSWTEPLQGEPHFTTLGHSVENYFFTVRSLEAYLRQSFSDHLEQNFFNDLEARFSAIVALAATYSLAIRNLSAITASDGAICRDSIDWIGGKYKVNGRLIATLTGRNINLVVDDFALLVNSNIDHYIAQRADAHPGRWLCHGHLGEQAILAAVANLAKQHGVSDQIALNIERGSKDNRFKHSIDYLCREQLHLSAPLEQAIDWLVSPIP
jgi:hypothetical protein